MKIKILLGIIHKDNKMRFTKRQVKESVEKALEKRRVRFITLFYVSFALGWLGAFFVGVFLENTFGIINQMEMYLANF